MESKLGQLFIIGLQGTQLTKEEENFIVENNIGGVILFDRNLESPEQIYKLTTDLQDLRKKMADDAPLFIGIDMEGGRVHRLKEPFTQWPTGQSLSSLDSTSVTFKFAYNMGLELKAVGINLDFAPCVDVLTNPLNKVIGDRALGTDGEKVAKLSSALVRGYIKSGIMPCAKHFPGHGNTLLDSHEELPVETKTLDELKAQELTPFKKVFRARLDMVMTAHIKFENIDSEPVTFSEKILKGILRDDLRFSKLVISDDLDMKALTNHYSVEEIPVRALKGGCDILLYCNEPASPIVAMHSLKAALASGEITNEMIEERYQRVLEVKSRLALPGPLSDVGDVVGKDEHKQLAEAIKNQQVPASLLTA